MIDLNNKQWHRDSSHSKFLISTQKALLDHSFINTAFATKEMFWAKPLNSEDLSLMLDNSVTAAIYEITPSIHPATSIDEPSTPREGSPALEAQQMYKQIGMARLMTDHVTFAYLSDVYIAPEHRGLGLAKWLIGCIKELVGMHPALRRLMLFTGEEKLQAFYERELGVYVMAERESTIVMSSNHFS
ncbi:hypothetical protein LTR78_005065 [Recurvomyces mirabilis]|uniref:N-acetyltransferase domain-containing protein n=1 Tax=Recurvomyces mirabilis TaxID=574656 RepID=A0AAE0WP02_9PEZI|nr:hypothetical protein LTR78_005065 [Recurvomyces mirabilis]KAK5158319.1 hypothetical protein LTS14_003337 [Recurvomyces mirabilis]